VLPGHISERTGRDCRHRADQGRIERAVVDVLRKLGFLEGAPKGRPPLRIVETEDWTAAISLLGF
jgi:ribosomal protein S19E (S16A)